MNHCEELGHLVGLRFKGCFGRKSQIEHRAGSSWQDW